jgi:hypothetical protein
LHESRKRDALAIYLCRQSLTDKSRFTNEYELIAERILAHAAPIGCTDPAIGSAIIAKRLLTRETVHEEEITVADRREHFIRSRHGAKGNILRAYETFIVGNVDQTSVAPL